MTPSKIHTQEFFNSLTDAEKFKISELTALVGRTQKLSFEEAVRCAHTEIEKMRADLRPEPIDDSKQCEASIEIWDEVIIGSYRCELHDDHYNQLHQITYPGLDGHIEVPIYWNDGDKELFIRKGRQYFECAGCGFSSYDEDELTNRMCVDCDQLQQYKSDIGE